MRKKSGGDREILHHYPPLIHHDQQHDSRGPHTTLVTRCESFYVTAYVAKRFLY
jgi:hypothetical protein